MSSSWPSRSKPSTCCDDSRVCWIGLNTACRPGAEEPLSSLEGYHSATKHSLASVQAGRQTLDWPNQPLPFKIYTSPGLDAIPLPLTFDVTHPPSREVDLGAIARLAYFS